MNYDSPEKGGRLNAAEQARQDRRREIAAAIENIRLADPTLQASADAFVRYTETPSSQEVYEAPVPSKEPTDTSIDAIQRQINEAYEAA